MIDWKAKRGKCPSCGREGEKGSRGTLGIGKFEDGPRRGDLVAHCHRCGHVAWPDDLVREEAAGGHHSNEKHERLSEYGQELWAQCRPLAGEALAYLQARDCAVPLSDGDLRWHPALKHTPSGIKGPALVALVSDAITGAPLTLHRTWINADGSKAAVDPPRMLLGGHRKRGGVVRLWPDECVGYGLGIAEGIESALTLARVLKPVWSCIDAGNLAQFPALPGIEMLTIAADHDEAGVAAARKCAQRWSESGAIARIVVAPRKGADLNDFVREVSE